MNKIDARQRILDAGAEIIHAKGFNNTGLKEILDAAGVPKGSFYFHFKNKEDLGLQLIDHHGAAFRKLAGECFFDQTRLPLGRLRRFFEALAEILERNGFRLGCPIGNLAQEMSDLSPAFRDRLAKAMGWMQGLIVHQLEEARMIEGQRVEADPAETARFILNSWQGAVMAAKLEKSRAPLDAFFHIVFNTLLAPKQPTQNQ